MCNSSLNHLPARFRTLRSDAKLLIFRAVLLFRLFFRDCKHLKGALVQKRSNCVEGLFNGLPPHNQLNSDLTSAPNGQIKLVGRNVIG